MKTLILFLVLFVVACKKDDIDPNLIGRWQYIGTEQHGVLTPVSNGGFVIFNSDGTIVSQNNAGVTIATGTYTVSGDELTTTSTTTQTAHFILTSSSLKLQYIADEYECYEKR